MIDKLDVRGPELSSFSPKVADAISQLRHGPVEPFRPARFYSFVGDLRKSHDIDAVLHFGYKFGPATHKLEVIDAGKKTLAEMLSVISQVFDLDPAQLSIMRVDLAADIPGVPVHWFRDKARFQFKQFASRIEKAAESELEFIAMGTAQAQSLYAGRRPNCVRIYDKIAEWYRQWRKLLRQYERFNRGLRDFELSDEERYYAALHVPSFQEWCRREGFEHREGATLTRVERQIGGDRIPPQLQTVGDLKRAHEFNPFQTLQIVSGGPITSFDRPPDSASIRNWLAALGFQKLRDDFGNSQQAVSYVTKFGNGNGKRVLETLLPLLPEQRPAVTAAEILERYRHTTEKQILGSLTGEIYLGPTYDEENNITESSAGILSATGTQRRRNEGFSPLAEGAKRSGQESRTGAVG
jgi:hypothetical protein